MIINLTDDQKTRWNIHDKLVAVYKVTNTLTGKVYIGQSIDLRKRVSEYNTAARYEKTRAIDRVIANYGTENFVLTILEECNKEVINDREAYYIELYKATNPEFGYNTKEGTHRKYSEQASIRKSISHTGLKETADTKRKKSNTIVAIGNDKIIFCDSGKLFGDLVGSTKDYIKNCLRQPSSIQGYRLYYLDKDKRNAIHEKMLQKRCIRDIEFIPYLKFLDDCEDESVETIYSKLKAKFGNIMQLRYENIADNKELFLKEMTETEVKELYNKSYVPVESF